MVDWHDIVWFKNAVPRHAFLLWVAIQRKLSSQDRLHRFGIPGPIGAHICLGAIMKITTTCSLNAPLRKQLCVECL
ncbi:hypothetical protein NC653_038867 [Populus alba x Populus x berolinensis]|uniref:Reverse transcriptase zinc-binding domain-containing protein n=1 Tax=Populus alba x Populus x berolinensis TaxID=444605 RepID=A0AAD6L9X3_9ROSI|nr:hypothetical protein NC653_038867 [Populus alba x Populus x berolinensis]